MCGSAHESLDCDSMNDDQKDFRSDRMESAEGKGIARRAWEAYARTVRGAPGYEAYARSVNRAAGPVTDPLVRRVAASTVVDLIGFWLVWHLDGGFEGLLALGWNRATIYRKISAFRRYTGQHPDEFEMPGVTFSVKQYQAAGSVAWKMRGPDPAVIRAETERGRRS